MKCTLCEGTGKRPYREMAIHADGSREIADKEIDCPECGGTGVVLSPVEQIAEMECRRAEAFGAGQKRSG